MAKIYEGATTAADIYEVRQRQGAREAAYQIGIEAVAEAVALVPVLGTFYSRAIEAIVGFQNWGQEFFKWYTSRQIDARVSAALR